MTPWNELFLGSKSTDAREAQELTYPGWQKTYLEAMLETNPEQLEGRAAAAEAAIQLRLRELTESADSQAERRCLADAQNGLQVLRQEEGMRRRNRSASPLFSAACREAQ
jgi:hypothetical protein